MANTTTTKRKTTAKKTTSTRKPAAAKKPAEKPVPVEETKTNIALEQLNDEIKKRDDEITELRELLNKLIAEQRPQIIQVANDSEKVYVRFQAECADDNVVSFGPGGLYGQITGRTGEVIVPKSEWSRFATDTVQRMIKKRELIVLSGFTDEEREAYGINYKDGEVLDKRAFAKLLDMGRELVAIYPALCPAHKEMIARRFITGYQQGHPAAHDRDLVVALNELSKEDYKDMDKRDPRRRGLFSVIIDAMNAKDAE